MTAYPRAELDAMVEHWLQANLDAEASGDWRSLADCFTEDATYGWNFGPKEHFMAVGRDEIRDIALGQEMGGLDGWQYPYEELIIDETNSERGDIALHLHAARVVIWSITPTTSSGPTQPQPADPAKHTHPLAERIRSGVRSLVRPAPGKPIC